ncbi:PREDICTED: PHD finger protein At3g20280-like isoform X3 [Camelina sativa]|uniref:PHD finger protein At3g20280-like isoform X3 n=1 Tax=Camelina sativa TaxID=90675 RepID=A0ABM0X288_CAMSA|nr:PREDICTED: PHD finger protein At3g20280-like isoform X3 [Camelina sativa]
MDVAISDVPVNLQSEEHRDGVDESVVVVDDEQPPAKKPRFDEEVNRVAEIVLVLSALRKIRGGKNPTELEIELMVEAKSKLVDMCQEFTPKDIISRDAIGAVIEDLGLNAKVKDQRLGFRAPKLTISEKLSLGKRKMEESKKNPVVSTTYTSTVHSSVPANHVSTSHQWPNSEVKATTSSVNPAPGSHFVRDASKITQPRIERPLFKSDMHTGPSQAPAVPAGNYYGNATTWSAQPHSSSSTISFGTASDSKVPVQSSSRVTDPTFRPFMSQTPPGAFPGMKGVSYGQTSSPFGNNNHAEIAKLIHKVLQPRAKQNVLWKPPSREYMSKAMTCQMCLGNINEVETVLICDACEKGYHLKCLQAHNMKGVPKSEWHCSRCVQLYNGKSFPPKYGRVMRSATTAKMSSSTAEVQSPAEKKVGKLDPKVKQEAMPHPKTVKRVEDSAMEQTVEAGDAAMNPIVGAEDAAMSPIVKAAMSQIVEAGDAAMNPTVDAEDAAMNPRVKAAMSQIVEAEDAAINQAVDANFDPPVPVGNADAECDDPSGPVSHSETLHPPNLEKKIVLSKDATERGVSRSYQDKTPKIIAESSVQEENSASQTENSPTQPPPSQSNADHVQQQNTSPNVQEAIQKNFTENPATRTEISLTQPPPLQSNTDHVQEQNTTPTVQEATQKNFTEDPATQTEILPTQPPPLQSNTDHVQQENTTPTVQEVIQKNFAENPATQTENPPTQPPPLQSNTDHVQQQNTTPAVQEAIQKNSTENSSEGKS